MESAAVRFAVFLGLFALFAALEALYPRKKRVQTRASRWATNWSVSILDTLTLRLFAFLVPALAVGAAVDAGENGVGLLNQLELPLWVSIGVTLLVMDFAIWAQHLASHKIPILWRLHRVHHSDRDIDVTTAIRFHPLEIGLSMLLKVALVYTLGAPAVGVVLFEVILNGMAMFNHANMRLPKKVDAVLRLIVVTPDMHRVHHSIYRAEHDQNYGFNLSIWDRLFGVYTAQPSQGHDDMTIGLEPFQDEAPARLLWTLKLPFLRKG